MEDMKAYSVRGYLESVDGRRVVGVLESGDLVNFDPHGGGVEKLESDFQAVGVHKARDALYVVGTSGAHPVLARLDESGKPGDVEPWLASLAAHDALFDKRVHILDDRVTPALNAVWTSPYSAIGPYPFVSPFTPEVYANGTTSWLIGGPSYRAGGDVMTAVAFLPMGISYP
jgi:hypothetical protein